MIDRDAEHPGVEGALPPEGGQAGHHLHQNVLGRVLRVVERAQHPQGEVEDQLLHPGQRLLQGRPVPAGGPLDQGLLVYLCVHSNTSYGIRRPGQGFVTEKFFQPLFLSAVCPHSTTGGGLGTQKFLPKPETFAHFIRLYG